MVTSPGSTSSAPTSAPSVAPLTSWRPSVTAAGRLPDRPTAAHHRLEFPPAHEDGFAVGVNTPGRPAPAQAAHRPRPARPGPPRPESTAHPLRQDLVRT